MPINIQQIFPQLKCPEDHFFSQQQFSFMPYFHQFSHLMSQKQIFNSIKKSKKSFKLYNIKKGTVIYLNNQYSDCAYFLCYGEISLLLKKNTKQKIDIISRHIAHKLQQKQLFLEQEYGIKLNKLSDKNVEQFINQFYQQKFLFKYLQNKRIYGNGYFGFAQMYRNTNRAYTAIVKQDSILLKIQKDDFQLTLKDFQSKRQEFIKNGILTINNNIDMINKNNIPLTQKNNKIQNQKSIQIENKQLALKFSQISHYIHVKIYQKEQTIYKQGQSCKFIYFLFKGQIQLHKTFKLQIPKKIANNQNKSKNGKEVHTKVSKLSEKCYFGQCQIFMNMKQRQFTIKATENNTIVFQIQPNIFLKTISQFQTYEKQLIILSRQKYSISMQAFLKSKNKVMKTFIKQFQSIQNKKQQKYMNNLINVNQQQILNQDGNIYKQINHKNMLNVQNQGMFEVFSKQGVFFRDTYEKLQGFTQFQANNVHNKRSAIRKVRISNHNQINTKQSNQKNLNIFHNFSEGQDKQRKINNQVNSGNQKLLYSPKKTLDFVQIISGSGIYDELTISKSLNKSKSIKSTKINAKHQRNSMKQLDKFKQLTKDQTVFKRVLIKNGRFNQDHTTYKSNIIKPIIHHKFDNIIKECMSRKNQVIRKAFGNQKNQIIKDTYQNTVEQLKYKNNNMSNSKITNFSITCKGTQQFKKKLDEFNKNLRRTQLFSSVKNKNNFQFIGAHRPTDSAKTSQNNPRASNILSNSKISNKNYSIYTDGQHNNQNETILKSKHHQNTSPMRQAFINNRNKQSNSLYSTFSNNLNHKSPQKFVLINHMMKPIVYGSTQFY